MTGGPVLTWIGNVETAVHAARVAPKVDGQARIHLQYEILCTIIGSSPGSACRSLDKRLVDIGHRVQGDELNLQIQYIGLIGATSSTHAVD